MILLDTNVISEFMRPTPEPLVVTWLDTYLINQVWISAISRAEIELGIELLPDGQRKQGLQQVAGAMFSEDFAGRCLAFDESAAICYGKIVGDRNRIGRPISVEDAQIAAIAVSNRLVLATRNVRDFESIDDLSLMNPWQPV